MAQKLYLKLLKRNLKTPINERIPVELVVSREKTARMRGNSAALRLQIEMEIAPKIQANRDAHDFLEGRRGEFQGCVTDHAKGHYTGHVYDMGKQTEPNLAYENSPEFHMIARAQEIKENEVKEKLAEDFN